MDGLKSYLSIINPSVLNGITGKSGEFIRLFQENEYLSEKAFAQKICGTNHNSKYYTNLKSKTKKILQALAIISTNTKDSSVKKKYDFCQKNFTVAQKFLTKGDRTEGLRLVRRAYRTANKNEFSHLACELASILYHDYIYYTPNPRMANFYEKEVEKHGTNYLAEKKAESYFYKMVARIHNGSVKSSELSETVKRIHECGGESIRCKVYKATMEVYDGLHKGKYQKVVSSCTRTLKYFYKKEGVYTSHRYFFLLHLGLAYIATSLYDKATISFKQAGKYAPSKSYNDYLLRFYKTLSALHAKEYQVAYELYLANKRCKIPKIREQFAIVEAYICFLAYTGHLQLKRAFRMGKYLNDTFKAQKDKQGDNLNILIAELLVYLVRDRGKFIDRIEAIQHYSYKHLKSKDTQRAKCFLKILCLLPKVNFHYLALERRAKRLINQLHSHPVRMGKDFAIEIIPYSQVLEMIMTQLGRKAA